MHAKILARQYLFPSLIFMAGIAVGIIATGGYATAPEPASAIEGPHLSNPPGGSTTLGAVGLAAQETPAPGTLHATGEEFLPAPRSTLSGEPDLESRLQAMPAAWARLQADVASLRDQVAGLQRRLPATTETHATSNVSSAQSSRPNTPEDRRSALITAGVGEDRAADIIWRRDQQELDHLELRDVATREGWFGSDRYREELSRIRQGALALREAIGEDAYDRYLFASREDNRVAIDSIIPGSTAEDAGRQPGDLVESYGGKRVFRFDDLRTATSEGERDELVLVRIRRGDAVLDVWLPRGPLGVHLDRASVDPKA